ncbi:GntR family transcriptional regulator [Oscillospiraceae bacterium MB08-C2-2]|nr:GntR family transcriptional regulator [Oscillospiraceae bacterium MB08-C2-2]
MPVQSLKERIYSQVLENIIQGSYPLESLINEKALVEEFGVSKSPVREALIELCNEGVLRSIPRCGYEVVRITDRDVQEIQDFRMIIEVGALDTYWSMLDQTHVERLQQMLDQHYQEGKEYNVLEHWQMNTEFHTELMSCFQNRYLYDRISETLRVLNRAYAQFYWDKWHQTTSFLSSAGCHRKVVDCIRTGSKEMALEYLRQDISTFDGAESGLRPNFSRLHK